MRVMSFNLKNNILFNLIGLWFFKYKKILEYINSKKLDVIGVQELTFTGKLFLSKYLLNYNIYGDSRKSYFFNNEFNCILINKKYKVNSCKTYSLSDNIYKLGNKNKGYNFSRICTVLHFEYKDKKYVVFNTHFDNSSTDNKKKMLNMLNKIILKEKLRNELLIVMGDFNMSINNSIKVFLKNNNLFDPFSDYVGSTFRLNLNMRKIDHIFIDFKLAVLSSDVLKDTSHISDHFSLVCEIKE